MVQTIPVMQIKDLYGTQIESTENISFYTRTPVVTNKAGKYNNLSKNKNMKLMHLVKSQ